ncbi:MAG: flagellar motor protein MotB [Syntrophales bacterium]|nr:flagellar motor protein MotB [Syntrophales bacterium]MDD5643094.1 flagellar motor protein MotB [Syntrophales bacterium]
MANLNGEAQFIRIVKKKSHHGGHHGGAWKVAYADFVTAMLALFIVLWIMAQSQSIRQNVAQYFKNPGLLPHSQGLMDNSNIGGEMPTPGHSQELQRPAPAPADVVDDQRRLEETKKKIQEMLAQMPELKNLKDQVRLEITDEGLRIELMEKEKARFFEVGSAKINQEAQKIFGVISKELGVLPNHLTIEGHTDSRPYGSQNYTNWELSADRANAARRLMGEEGVKPGQISEVRGYADRRLYVNDNPNDDRNRRVSIIVRYLDKDKQKPLTIKPAPARAAPKAAPPAALGKPAPAPAPTALPAPSPPAGKAKADHRGQGAKKAQAAAVQKTPPSTPKETQPEKKPLEDNVGLQKELLNIFPKPGTIKIK